MDLALKLGLKATLEPPIGNHVPDVLLDGEQPLAIEFQCSPCNSMEISERTKTYYEHGVATLWILGKAFYKDLMKKTRKKIEREIENFHPTIYFVDNKFKVVRENPKYYDYYWGGNNEPKRLEEDFDIECHLLNFVKQKLSPENPHLVFKWMEKEPEIPKQEEEPVETKLGTTIVESPKTGSYRIIPASGWKKRRIKVTMDEVPIIIIYKRIQEEKICESCGTGMIEYSVRVAQYQPLKKCEACLNRMRKEFSNAEWKMTE